MSYRFMLISKLLRSLACFIASQPNSHRHSGLTAVTVVTQRARDLWAGVGASDWLSDEETK